MAWQHKFLVFNFLGMGLTHELEYCVVDGTPAKKLPACKAIRNKQPTLEELANKVGEQSWQVASQSIAPLDNE